MANLLVTCVFVLDKQQQQQQQQQQQSTVVRTIFYNAWPLWETKQDIFYGTHNTREFAQHVVVQAAIPAANV